jgi:hypothetical protein
MSAAIKSAFAPLALVATLLTSSAAVAAPANTTPADNCLAAPNTAAPPGHRWYYRTDRATQRKCWYVRAPNQPAQQAAAPAKKGAAKPLHATSAPFGPPPAAETAAPANSGEANRLAPQIEMPAVTPPVPMPATSAAPKDTASSVPAAPTTPAPPSEPSEPRPRFAHASSETPQDPAPSLVVDAAAVPDTGRSASAPSGPPAIDATTAKPGQQSARAEIAASIPAASPPPATTPSEANDQATALPTVTSVKAQNPIAAPTDAAALVSDDAKRTGRGDESTNSSGMLMLVVCSIILVLGLVLFGLIWRVTRKYAAAPWGTLIPVFGLALVGLMRRVTRKYTTARSDQIFTDDSWYNPYDDPEFCHHLRQGSALHRSWEPEDTTINQRHLRF